MAQSIGTVVSSRLATLRELDEYYGVTDLYDLIEIVSVDSHNRRLAAAAEPGGP